MAINKNDYLDANGDYDLKKDLIDELIDLGGIEESGTNSGISWRKYSDGTMEVFGVATITNTTSSSVDVILPVHFKNNDYSVSVTAQLTPSTGVVYGCLTEGRFLQTNSIRLKALIVGATSISGVPSGTKVTFTCNGIWK